jgi:L,D-peptidoglycan transpeptidase YkuD (ErfK/YbiS/YcfS/YnhG family)
VITYVAKSYSSTSGTLQAWNEVDGHWVKYGSSIHAWGGSDGLTKHMSEFRSATQVGSFSLTQAFGYEANPGTKLPYFKTQPDDWWISQSGPLYNTHQRCASHCAFTQGAPNEHLYYETPDYDYAVVININTAHPVYPDGSAVFLHVTRYRPTAGCISIPVSDLVHLMRWLLPSAHPRILIGVAS